MKIGNREFQESGKTYVCGILNVTPDSFSDGGKWVEQDKALFHVEEMIKDGMDLLDIGGESTRPGYRLLSCEEELGRVLPVIEAVKKRFDVPISLDTYKPEVAEEGVKAGIDFINDIWGLKWDKRMADGAGHCKIRRALLSDAQPEGACVREFHAGCGSRFGGNTAHCGQGGHCTG